MQPPNRFLNYWLRPIATALLAGAVLETLLTGLIQVGVAIEITNQATYSYEFNNDKSDIKQSIQTTTNKLFTSVITTDLIDPLGKITGCAGETLPDYTGFSIGLYEPNSQDATTTEIAEPVPLTRTESPDIANNNIPRGLEPNTENSNPFFLTNGKEGTYNFLLDPQRGQLDRGKTYILLIHPPDKSIYDERRIKLTIGERDDRVVAYTATSLDGKPISATDNRTSINGTIDIENAERIGLVLAVLDLDTSVCQAQEVQVVKTGDRATAEPGDTVIYRLSVKNLSSSPLKNIVVTDTLPLGFTFIPKSVRAELGKSPVAIASSHDGRTISLRAEGIELPSNATNEQVLNIAYAAVLTADAVRGTGENLANVTGQRIDNNQTVKDGPAVHRLRINPGILSDCGTLIGRVFVDKNFDGEQQPGEPGVPNAVIFMDDGNRITTDLQGLFSVANVISGYRTGVLDFSSVPGYTLAPNRRFIERNSQSRLVHLEPGGMARMNFAVTPIAKEAKPK